MGRLYVLLARQDRPLGEGSSTVRFRGRLLAEHAPGRSEPAWRLYETAGGCFVAVQEPGSRRGRVQCRVFHTVLDLLAAEDVPNLLVTRALEAMGPARLELDI